MRVVVGLSTLIALWRASRRRRGVVRLLAPYVDRWRLADGGARWADPAVVGFLITLITRLGQPPGAMLGGDALGALQADVWGALTGEPSDILGEQVVALSVGEDPHFLRGCRNALVFADALAQAQTEGFDRLGATIDPLPSLEVQAAQPLEPGRRDALQTLWNGLIGGTDEADRHPWGFRKS